MNLTRNRLPPEEHDLPLLVPAAEACRMLGVSRLVLRRMIHLGKLAEVKVGQRRIYITRASLRALGSGGR